MKKIIFNGSSIIWNEIFGVQRNTLELLYELDKIIEPGIAEVVVPKSATKKLEFSNIEVVKHESIKHSRISMFLWNHLNFPKYVKSQGGYSIDLVLGLPFSGCDVVGIYDCISELFPENSNTIEKKLTRLFYMQRVKRNLKTSKFVITDSKSAKEDISRIYHCDKSKIFVIPCAWQHFERVIPDYSILDKYNLSGKDYFFSLGSRYMHKNFKWIAEAAKLNHQYTFVVSGSSLLNTSDIELNSNKTDNMIFTGYLNDEQVKALMSCCKAFIQPSLYEGFGIPPLEAMSSGANVIVSNTSSLPEVYKDSVWYIDPNDYTNIDLDKIMQKDKKPNKLILDEYSWAKSAEELKELLYEYLT